LLLIELCKFIIDGSLSLLEVSDFSPSSISGRCLFVPFDRLELLSCKYVLFFCDNLLSVHNLARCIDYSDRSIVNWASTNLKRNNLNLTGFQNV